MTYFFNFVGVNYSVTVLPITNRVDKWMSKNCDVIHDWPQGNGKTVIFKVKQGKYLFYLTQIKDHIFFLVNNDPIFSVKDFSF